MKEIQVQFASRFIERQWSTAVGRSLLKTLAEPITNSDDSYRRMVDAGTKAKGPFPITIFVDRNKRIVRITDEAQGMTRAELENKFEEYGAAKSSAYEGGSSRGIFGQGISDVLFHHKKGSIKSVKNGEASVCTFYKKNGKPFISVDKASGGVKASAERWGINADHGTSIEFEVDETTPIHDYENLARKIGNFYMLRLINANDDRAVKLIYKDGRGTRTADIKYVFPTGELVEASKTFMVSFENYSPVRAEVQLYRAPTALPTTDEERANGLLVFDDKNAIYDQTFFGLENLRGADKYFGMMKLTGAREIILDKINSQKPEAILTDSRDGFDKQHEFFKLLTSSIRDWLYPILNEEGKRKTDEGLSESMQENHRQAFEELNKLYAELSGEDTSGTIRKKKVTRPAGGLAFARNNITVTEGKRYGLQLIVDAQTITPGSKIMLVARKKGVKITPQSITLKKSAVGENGLAILMVYISGRRAGSADTVVASCGQRRASVVVSVVADEIVYPANGIIFSPDYLSCAPHSKHAVHLFVDTTLIKPGSKIVLNSTNNKIVLEKKFVTVPSATKKDVAHVQVVFSSSDVDEMGFIEASHKEYTCQCHIDIKDPQKMVPPSPAGKFRGWDFDDSVPRGLQTMYDHIPGSPTQGFIFVSSNHPINKEYFGDQPTKEVVETSRVAQLYLAELILNESLGAMIGEAYRKGIIQPTYGPDQDIPFYIAQKKFELGPKIYSLLVPAQKKKSQLNREEKLEAAKQALKTDDENILSALEGRGRDMVAMYFGLGDERPHTLEEIGAKEGVTRERVRQIINKALAPKLDKPKWAAGSVDEKAAGEIDGAWVDYLQQEEDMLNSAIEQVVETTARTFGLTVYEMKERTRRVNVAIPRQIAIYLLRKVLNLSYPAIGKVFGFDHTTVIYACGKVQKEINKNKIFASEVEKAERAVGDIGSLITLREL